MAQGRVLFFFLAGLLMCEAFPQVSSLKQTHACVCVRACLHVPTHATRCCCLCALRLLLSSMNHNEESASYDINLHPVASPTLDGV